MKKFVAFILCIALLLSFCGCQSSPENTQPPETVPTPTEPVAPTIESTQATQPQEAAIQQPMFSVSVPVTTQETAADDGTVIYRHTYQNMLLTMPDPDVAHKVIVDFLNRVDATGSSAGAVLEAARSDYAPSESWTPYTHSTLYSPTRMDQSILSLYGSCSFYSGAAHPTHISISANYDLITGNYLSLSKILTEESAVDKLCQLLTQVLESAKETTQLYPYYESIVRDILCADPEYCGNWYFSWSGLCFYFSPYEIAPYASGVIEAEIPYAQLLGILNDAYFPPEYSCIGSVEATAFETADISKFTQICEVTETGDAQKIILHSGDTAVSHITLEVGAFSQDGITYLPTATIFASSTLTPGDAILLETDIPDTMPRLRLSYMSGEDTVQVYITQSGKDGTILLINP